MQLRKLKMVTILASLLLASACSPVIVKPQPLPLPVCPDLVQIHPTELIVVDDNVIMTKETMVKIVKRDAMRRACTLLHRAVIESTYVQ